MLRFAFPKRMLKEWCSISGRSSSDRGYFSMAFKKAGKNHNASYVHCMVAIKFVFAHATGPQLCSLLKRNNLHLPSVSEQGKLAFVDHCVKWYDSVHQHGPGSFSEEDHAERCPSRTMPRVMPPMSATTGDVSIEGIHKMCATCR